MKNIAIILFLLVAAFDVAGEQQNYFFEQISPESGFAFDAVYTISEDCNGFVWFGCNNGLYYYNTASITKVDLLPQQKNISQSLSITCILHDLNCELWVCTEEGLFKRDSLENSFSKIEMYSADSSFNTLHNIDQILQFDQQLYLLIAENEAFYFDKNEMILHKIDFEQTEISGPISVVTMDLRGNILFGNNSGKIFTATHPKNKFELFYDSGSDAITSICDDHNKYYVGFNNKGIEVINISGDKINSLNHQQKEKLHLPDDRVRSIIKTEKGDIWIGTYMGIVVFTKNENKVITNLKSNGLPQKSIYVLHRGKNNGIWVGTWAGGIAYYSETNYRFNHIPKVPEEKEIKSVVSSFFEDNNKNIWVGSEQAGISIYNTSTNTFEKIPDALNNANLLRIKTIYAIEENKIVLGTFDQGLWMYDINLQKAEKITDSLLPDASIITTITGNNKEIWFGTRGAGHSLFNYNFEEKKFQYFDIASQLEVPKSALRVWKLLLDTSHKLWACTDEGLYFKNKNDTYFQKCFVNDTVYGLDRTMIYTIFEDKNAFLWLGTKGKGIFQYDGVKQSLKSIKNNSFLNNIDIFGVTEDNQGKIWFSSDNGIFCYFPEINKTVRYTSIDGLPGEQFTPNSILTSSIGELFFGSSNGFCFIDPEKIKINTIKPRIFLSKLFINNRPFSETENMEANSFIIEEINDITLRHSQNSLTFSVTANNFIKPQKNTFKYRLLNYEENWIEAGLNQDISFTKIPPGSYILEVLGANNDKVWNDTPLRIHIKIKYPIWETWYAVLVYIMLVSTVIFLVVKELDLRLKLRKEILAERFKSEAQEQLYDQKIRFFTNVSHEIRTPLTLILSPLNNLLNKFKYDNKTSEQLLIIRRNSQRLLRLTNQILDFRLLEVNKLMTHYQKTDVIKICSEIIYCFDMLLKEKQINFIFSSNYKMLWINIDADMIEKIVYNLLSNAIKFSEEKSQIFLSIESKELSESDYQGRVSAGNLFTGKTLEIKIRDFGKGIKKEILPTILERFATDPEGNETGTGIGLHLSQEYARLHNGNILVESEEGVGSTFILNIPFQKNSEYDKTSVVKQILFENGNEMEMSEPEKTTVTANKKVVLLVEDNDELRNYLKNYLNNYYKVITAKNGNQAIEIAKEVIPDILITDILMPQSDGIELTEKIKSNRQTSEIPIIVLTALSESKYQKKSLQKGVDSYLIKPVDETLLLAQIENLLNKKAMLKKRLQPAESNQTEIGTSNYSIIERTEKLVEQNLRNSGFDMEELLTTLNISRSTFHRKIKQASNQSPSEFIRDIRLKNAVKMMKSGNYNIDEIGTYVGFNSTSYFIRSFKKKYGKTPKEYYAEFKQKN